MLVLFVLKILMCRARCLKVETLNTTELPRPIANDDDETMMMQRTGGRLTSEHSGAEKGREVGWRRLIRTMASADSDSIDQAADELCVGSVVQPFPRSLPPRVLKEFNLN
jgi:hypothetical protein